MMPPIFSSNGVSGKPGAVHCPRLAIPSILQERITETVTVPVTAALPVDLGVRPSRRIIEASRHPTRHLGNVRIDEERLPVDRPHHCLVAASGTIWKVSVSAGAVQGVDRRMATTAPTIAPAGKDILR